MKTQIALLLFLPLISTVTANISMAEMKQTTPYHGVITDKRGTPEKEDDRYWYGREDEKQFLQYSTESTESDIERYKTVDDPNFSNLQWGPWAMEKDENDVIIFKKHHGTKILFYGNPLLLDTITSTPVGSDLHFGELIKEVKQYDIDDKLLLNLQKEKPANNKQQTKEKDQDPIIIRNEYPGGYEYQTVRKYTDVGVWVVMRPR